ncbi:acyl-CoA dehydrogenase [Allopusillimonas ginsengisoli]|nr:acyl-CoA dehydrogenase [Allopusillimonas ginsengisoli]
MNRPAGDELLSVARRALLDELLPLLPEGKTYDVLMIANAMAIAARELAATQAAGGQGVDQAASFLRAQGAQSAEPAEAELAALIRRRDIDTSRHSSLRAVLLSLTQAKLALSNPKYLRHEAN